MNDERSKVFKSVSDYLLANVPTAKLIARYRGEFNDPESEYAVDKSVLLSFENLNNEGEDYGVKTLYTGDLLIYVACVNMAHSYKTVAGNADEDNAVADWEFAKDILNALLFEQQKANGYIAHVKYLQIRQIDELINNESMVVHLLRFSIEFCV